jgi:hypothetical protein
MDADEVRPLPRVARSFLAAVEPVVVIDYEHAPGYPPGPAVMTRSIGASNPPLLIGGFKRPETSHARMGLHRREVGESVAPLLVPTHVWTKLPESVASDCTRNQ